MLGRGVITFYIILWNASRYRKTCARLSPSIVAIGSSTRRAHALGDFHGDAIDGFFIDDDAD